MLGWVHQYKTRAGYTVQSTVQ